MHGEQVADEWLVSHLTTTELNVLFADNLTPIPLFEPPNSTTRPPTRMIAKMASTGQVLKVKLDTTLSVSAVRQQIAAVLDTGDDTVVLMGPDGRDLSDVLTLDALGLSELLVAQRQRSIVLATQALQMHCRCTGEEQTW